MTAGADRELLDAERELVVRREQLETLARQALADAEKIEELELKLLGKQDDDRRKRQIFETQSAELGKMREDNEMLTAALKKLATELEAQRMNQEESMRAFEGQGEMVVRKLKMELAVLQDELDQAEKKSRDAESQSHSSTFSKLRKEREALSADLEEQAKLIARLQAELSLKSQESERAASAGTEAREESSKLSRQLEQLRQQMLDLEDEKEQATKNAEELAQLKDKMNRQEAKFRNTSRAVEAVEEQKLALQKKLGESEKALAKQKSRVRKLVSDMALATSGSAEARAELEEVKSKLEAAQATAKNAEAEAKVATGGDRAAKQLSRTLQEKEQELSDVLTDRDSLRTQYYNMKAGVQSMQNAMTERSQGYEAKLDEMRKQMEEMQSVAAELRTMTMQVKMLNSERDGVESSLVKLGTKIEQIDGRADRSIRRSQGLAVTEEE